MGQVVKKIKTQTKKLAQGLGKKRWKKKRGCKGRKEEGLREKRELRTALEEGREGEGGDLGGGRTVHACSNRFLLVHFPDS